MIDHVDYLVVKADFLRRYCADAAHLPIIERIANETTGELSRWVVESVTNSKRYDQLTDTPPVSELEFYEVRHKFHDALFAEVVERRRKHEAVYSDQAFY
jgi:hypothetical protein